MNRARVWRASNLTLSGRREGQLTRMWRVMSDVMIAKCAEALALRKAFPQELSGLYTGDEMEQTSQPETTGQRSAPAPVASVIAPPERRAIPPTDPRHRRGRPARYSCAGGR